MGKVSKNLEQAIFRSSSDCSKNMSWVLEREG